MSMKNWWSEWYNKYAVVVACGIACYVSYNGVCWSTVDGQTWAAWVQAVGAIVAIAGGWLGVRHQIRSAEKSRDWERAQAKAGMASVCFAAAYDAVTALNHVVVEFKEALEGKGWKEIGAERYEVLAQTFATLSQRDMIALLFREMISIQREIAYTLTAVRQYNKSRSVPTAARLRNAEHRLLLVSASRNAIEAVLEAYSEAAARLDGQ